MTCQTRCSDALESFEIVRIIWTIQRCRTLVLRGRTSPSTFPDMPDRPSRSGVQSVHRALDALELLGRSSPLGIRTLATAVGLPTSTAHGLVSTLVRRGYAMRTESGFALGPAAASLAGSWNPADSLPLVLERLTAELAALTGHAATATVLAGLHARVLAYSPATGPITVRVTPRQWRDPLAMSTGRLLVALGPRERWTEFITATAEETGWSEAQWRSELEDVRRRRSASRRPSDPRSEASTAVPVGLGDDVICAIGCSAPAFMAAELFDPEVHLALTRCATEVVSELGLGRRPAPATTTISKETFSDRAAH